VTVTARIAVSNRQQVPLTGLVVTAAGGGSVYVGDVGPDSDVASAPFTFALDVSEWPSRSVHVPVKLTFFVEGKPVEVDSGLSYVTPE
jgi:hypothetical protein